MTKLPSLTFALLLVGAAACGDDEVGADAGPVVDSGGNVTADAGVADTGTLRADSGTELDAGSPIDSGATTVGLEVTHPASAPFAPGGGGLAWIDDDLFVVGTAGGISAITTTGTVGAFPVGYTEWTLTSTGMGAAASAIAIPPTAAGPADAVYFLPTGAPQVGGLLVGTPGAQGEVIGEALLPVALESLFPSSLQTTVDALWAVDAVFGPGSTVRAYPYAGFMGTTPAEDGARRLTPSSTDYNEDGADDVAVLGALTFSPDGSVGLVGFTLAFPGVAGVAGGVIAFDVKDGSELGFILVPNVDTATTTSGFVGPVAAWQDRILIGHNELDPMFSPVGGHVSIYRVESWIPFVVTDADGNAVGTQPSDRVAMPLGSPRGIAVVEGLALITDSPFFADSALQIVELDDAPALDGTLSIDNPYTIDFNLPGAPVVSPDQSQVMISTEAGVVRIGVTVQ